ncbi:PREDICTED: CMP-N-acetylneuraminate-beta-galactosamide-alpha-2,3-sialyltransferase 2-like isoform X2 [Crocodylus porosus]|uniref:CMP-N-acetylneuraminate-beta-galactosamide- alpha-2,3-sialyltransferase 2-like isoform X2 n=1 Tax=Crocodylus porosus TaxID=8502 RepID=UPI00093D2E73|nr:PREDICTED: CMP-N-acetylneuraminate-beta-galactosamide-alpha-2,3-sialyltransferase 2-like isoform X2 [Crocodylus porosus]
MLLRKKLWATAALCLVFLLWKTFQGRCTGHFASLCSLVESSGPVSIFKAKLCSCASCVADLSSSAWFNEHYDAAINPVLTVQTQEISPDVLQWWLKLQGSQSRTQVQGIIRHMFDILPFPVTGAWDTVGCRTCAVVGNSGKLKGSSHGTAIDSHDWVLRMNRAQTVGFEKDVGTRTTHHFMYPESAINLQHGVHLVLVPFKLQDLKWVTSAFSTGELTFTYTKVKQFIKADRNKVLILNPAFLKYIHDNWTQHHGKYPSTGLTALLFALHVCDQMTTPLSQPLPPKMNTSAQGEGLMVAKVRV